MEEIKKVRQNSGHKYKRSADEDGSPSGIQRSQRSRRSVHGPLPVAPKVKLVRDQGTQQKPLSKERPENSDPWSGFKKGICGTEKGLSC